MAIRIKDVARAAGVSEATVSLALNRSSLVNQKTGQRIRALAKEMGYAPNPYAKKLALQKSGVVGLVVPDIENVYYAGLVRHINRFMRAAGYGLSIAISENQPRMEADILDEMIRNRVEGVLLAPMNVKSERKDHFERLERAGIPLLFVTARYEGVEANCVMCDLEKGMRELVKHLMERGCTHPVLLTGPEGVQALDERVRGFLRVAGAEALVERLDEVSYSAACRSVEQLLWRGIRFDALLCVNDLMALGAMNILEAHGCKVPDQVSVCGFDDVVFSRITEMPITTACQPLEQLAREAVFQIERAMIGGEMQNILLDTRLVIRKSSR